MFQGSLTAILFDVLSLFFHCLDGMGCSGYVAERQVALSCDAIFSVELKAFLANVRLNGSGIRCHF